MSTLIFITYDGINNSVFEGQVLEPLRIRKTHNPEKKYILISFERNPKKIRGSKTLDLAQTLCDEVHILKRFPYLGRASLYHSVYHLRSIFKNYSSYEIIARGPLAGWVALQARDQKKCSAITLQARGLCAEEYAYTHTTPSLLTRWWHAWRYHSLASVEHAAYSQSSCTIESVSSALSSYLVKTFHTKPELIVAAPFDLPPIISQQKKIEWRNVIREKLGISKSTVVYCYNGSMKSWQCPELVIAYVEKAYTQNPDSFLLVLTHDVDLFTNYMSTRTLPSSAYAVMYVPHHEIYNYLCAADKGIIFRKPSIINWVSRPTKILEYRATHLNIIHNNTIGYIHQPKHTDVSGNTYYEGS